MNLRSLAGLAVVVASLGCNTAAERKCDREMRAVREREALRVHGLSENDDAGETILKLRGAMGCAGPEDVEELRVYAHLLESRLAARGRSDELGAVAEKLDEIGLGRGSTELDAAPAAVAGLTEFASAMRAASVGQPDAALRAHLLSMALDPKYPTPLPTGTRAVVNFSHERGGCFTLINHQDLPSGTAVVSLKRADATVPLHGDPTTFGTSQSKPRIVRLCTDGPLRAGDVVRVSIGKEVVWTQSLTVTPDDDIRGAMRRDFKGVDISALCAQAKEHAARTACAIASARSAP